MSAPTQTIQRPSKKMLVPQNTFSMGMWEFCNRLVGVFHTETEVDQTSYKPSGDSVAAEFALLVMSVRAIVGTAQEGSKWKSFENCAKTLLEKILRHEIYFEHPTTHGKVFVTKFDENGQRIVKSYSIPMSLLQKFAVEEYNVEISWEPAVSDEAPKFPELGVNARESKKEKTLERDAVVVEKGLEIKLRHHRFSVPDIARAIVKECDFERDVKTIQNILYKSKKFTSN